MDSRLEWVWWANCSPQWTQAHITEGWQSGEQELWMENTPVSSLYMQIHNIPTKLHAWIIKINIPLLFLQGKKKQRFFSVFHHWQMFFELILLLWFAQPPSQVYTAIFADIKKTLFISSVSSMSFKVGAFLFPSKNVDFHLLLHLIGSQSYSPCITNPNRNAYS